MPQKTTDCDDVLVGWVYGELVTTGKRQFVYRGRDGAYLKTRFELDNGDSYLATFSINDAPKNSYGEIDHDAFKCQIHGRVKRVLAKAAEGPHIRSSLEPSLPVMRLNMDDD